MHDTKNIGHKIAAARKNLRLSQAELAQRLFISPQAVGKWERGESMPDLITFDRLALLLGVDLNYFSESFPSASAEKPETPGITVPLDPPEGNEPPSPARDMSHGNWREADFSGLKNLHERFSSSNIQRCKFIGSELSGLLLRNNNVDRCDFSGSDISTSRIQGSNLTGNRFNGCSLKEAGFQRSYVSGCDFSGADLSGVTFRSGGLEKNILAGTVWNRSSFAECHLIDLVFEGTLADCSFENCSFTRVRFEEVTLRNTFFKNNRKMKKVRFIGCKADKLTYAFLKSNQADLSGVTLLDD